MDFMGDWQYVLGTMFFATLLIVGTVFVAEVWGKVWAPIWIMGLLVGISILFDYGGAKLTQFEITGRILLFAAGPLMWPVMALGQDYLNEFYGPKVAYHFVMGMFLAKVGVALGTIWIIFVLPVPTVDAGLGKVADDFNRVLGIAPRLNVASIIAVVVSMAWNAWFFNLIRVRTGGGKLWLRNISSSVTSLTIDAVVFFGGAFAFVLPWAVISNMTISYLLLAYLTIIVDAGFLYGMAYMKNKGLLGMGHRIGEKLVMETRASADA